MLTLVNTNRMTPPIAPVGLEYVATAVRDAGFTVELLDLCLAERPAAALAAFFDRRQPNLVGLTFRNVDDCFWPSAQSFLELLEQDIREVRAHTDAPIVLGGVGYSIFPQEILARTGAEFGVHGDGEPALVALLRELQGGRRWERVPGLVFRQGSRLVANPPAWPSRIALSAKRDLADNATYFRRGGQMGVETKRGCRRRCIYCVDPLAKGRSHRLRDPSEVADEIEALAAQEIDVLHFCDPEFNLPPDHALAVCEELICRALGQRVRWYAYLAVTPFTAELARAMRRAGCVGINFTSDSADPAMLATYRHAHRLEHLREAIRLCRTNSIAVMLDMMLGGPGETPETVTTTINGFRQLDPDCAGAALGIRIYPGTAIAEMVAAEGPQEANPNLRRRYSGPNDLLKPTFYISSALGEQPARLVRELIGDDPRFFPPSVEPDPEAAADDHNYNDNRLLVEAISGGMRGAFWHILRQLDSR